MDEVQRVFFFLCDKSPENLIFAYSLMGDCNYQQSKINNAERLFLIIPK